MTSCFDYKVMGLTFHDRINTQLINRFELAQVVARRITKPHRFFLGLNLTGCSFLFSFFFFFFFFFLGGGGGSVFLFFVCLIVFFLTIFLLLFSICNPFSMYKAHI